MARADQSLRTVGPESEVGKLRRAEAADAVSANPLYAKIDLLVEQGPVSAGAETAASSSVVESPNAAGSGNCCGPGGLARASHLGSSRIHNIGARVRADNRTGKDAIAEGADDTKDLVVAKARIDGGLEDEVGSLVNTVARRVERVVETAAAPGALMKKFCDAVTVPL